MSSYKLYGIPNCNSVKKAIDWLKENKVDYEFVDYKKETISRQKLKQWCKYFGWDNMLNKKGTTWQKLSNEKKDAIKNEVAAINLMIEQPGIIKRPILEANNKWLIRFNQDEYELLVNK